MSGTLSYSLIAEELLLLWSIDILIRQLNSETALNGLGQFASVVEDLVS